MSPAPLEPLEVLSAEITACRACPRLVAWREQVARERRAAYRDQAYWGRPLPGFGDPAARILLLGLAPAAHGGNRTGRVFTGDRSGDFLFAALHRVGLANQARSEHPGDGLRLRGAYVIAAVRCAPPANAPTPQEFATCRPWLERELALLPEVRVVLCLGGLAHRVAADLWGLSPRPRFGHGTEVPADPATRRPALLGAFHPSQQNTFTGRLTPPMLDAVLARAVELAGFPAQDRG